MKNVIRLCICFWILTGCKKEKPVEATLPPEFQPQLPAYYNLFNRNEGWIGGDIASSIALSTDKVLWLFGDSWKGTIADNKRTNYTFTAHNSIAIQNGIDPSSAALNYYFGSKSSGTFFTPDDNVGMIWPMHGAMIGGELYVFFVQVENSSNSSLGFKLINSVLVQVSNPLDAPSQWNMKQYKIPNSFFSATKQIVFGAYVMQKNGYTYIYGTETDNVASNRYLLLSRVKSDSLTNFTSWQYYSQGKWQNNFPDRLTDRMGFEFSVSYHPDKKKYVLINTDLGFSHSINIQYSDSLWGNWTSPALVYQCPEPAWGKNNFCYAAKAHPELSSNSELIVTYVANSINLDDVINDSRLYWPRFIKIDY